MQVPAKILLFGEHIVLQGAPALALPWHVFAGTWAWAAPAQHLAKQQNLPDFLDYLRHHAVGQLLKLDLFQRDLEAGIYFDSTIPSGYGAGSSGALCAAIFHRYLRIGPKLSLQELKAALGALESFFHGSSSGTDPLICYLDRAVLLSKGGSIQPVDLPTSPFLFFVIDTGISRQTGPWVKEFLRISEQKAFKEAMQAELIPASNQAIQAILNPEPVSLWQAMEVISNFHFRHLASFIPAAFHHLWQQSLATKDFKLKICGAGGGGFILGLAKSAEILEELKLNYVIHSVEW